MRRKREKISIQIPKVTVLRVNVRTKMNEIKSDEEYAVIQVTFHDTFDEHALSWKSKKVAKIFTLVCFREEIWRRLIESHKFSFEGFASLKYGGVYFVVEKAYDEFDFDIEKEESVYFTNFKPLDFSMLEHLYDRSTEEDSLSI